MSMLPGGLEQSFQLAAGELGMCAASWLFTRELGAVGGADLIRLLKDRLGRSFPVLDFVATRWLAGDQPRPMDTARIAAALQGVEQLLVVGLETDHLDALLPRLHGVRVSVLMESPLPVDWPRVLANLGPSVQGAELASFQKLAGRRSALLTFLYGHHARTTHTVPSWLRVMGPDVRSQFRTIIGWDVLGASMTVHPRWLFQIPLDDFTDIID